MKKNIIRSILVLGACLMAGWSASLRAEDIDIYVDNVTTSFTPNVLFVIDNSSNVGSTWSSTNGCKGYAGGTAEAPSLGTDTAGGIIQCALVDAINSLPDGVLNMGIMSGNANGFGSDRGCVGKDGGCLLYPLTLVDSKTGTRQAMVQFIKSWKADSGNNDPSKFPFTVTSAAAGGMMQESWAYFSGRTGLSGRSYSSSILQSGCQDNFIIYIGNTDKTPANEDASGAALATAGASTGFQGKITSSVVFDPPICGVPGISGAVATNNANDWSSNWADEWARFMQETDAGTSDMEGVQNVKTYSIGIINNGSNQCTASYPALLQSMANYGNGKSFRVGNASEITDAIAAALNEVQAVNSVFSSASLPVSVNAEGSYLNQIFLGMFRPDASGAPRWLGNLKQYQLIRYNGRTVMGDARTPTPQPAISSAKTGFLSPNAISFWTKKDATGMPDSLGGFFVNDKKGTPASGFDSPDGEVVEKGGVAQQLRLQNLTATFTGASGTSGNPRRVYTYCPSGSASCSDLLTAPENDFSTANAGISSSMFGETTSIPISAVTRVGSSSTAAVATSSNHGLTTGDTVTISGVTPAAFNVTQAITVTGSKTFTISGVPTYPTTPSAGTFSITPAAGAMTVTSISRTTRSITGVAQETATISLPSGHGITTSTDVVVSGAVPAEFNFSGKPSSVTATSISYPITIDPPPTNQNVYQVAFTPVTPRSVSLTLSGTTVTASLSKHGYFVGQSVVIAGAGSCSGTFKVASVPNNGNSFSYKLPTAPSPVTGCSTGTVAVDTAPVTIASSGITRPTTVPGVATATIGTSNWFGLSSGNTATVDITQVSGSASNETGFLASRAVLTCKNSGCTQFSYSIPITAASATAAAGSSISVAVPSSIIDVTMPLQRSSTGVVTVSGLPSGVFTNGQTVIISATGTPRTDESGYTGSWKITCTAPCTSFTYGPVNLTPNSGSGGVVFARVAPNRDNLIKWVRGADNQGDEKGPGGGVTVRGSIHGDVLHSRPLVVNYGDSRGIVVFYGSNDGLFRAVNGNTTDPIASVPAGGELWGLVLPEHFGSLGRLRTNSPEVKFPSSFLSTAQPKDYFIDGPTGAYQKLKADGTIDKAYLYLTMRRGGRFIYAIDVTVPTAPKFLWKKSASDAGFEELGQTWSRPRLTLLQNYGKNDASGTFVHTPVLVFGAGYDSAEDAEPPGADDSGRGIFVVNAETGALVWSATPSCPASSATCLNVPDMQYAIPSEVAFVDRDNNGYIDKFYVGDLGGNLWRADVSASSPSSWRVKRVAALGCDTASGGPVNGVCPSGTTPRKFFFPPSILSVRAAGASGSYEAISIASGDREHPLKSTAAGSAYNVTNRFFMIKDVGTTLGAPAGAPSTEDVTSSSTDLFNATSTAWDGSKNGFYITLAKGEKVVNAPLAVNGLVYFSTNRPTDPDKTCASNLGEAKAYAVNPFDGSMMSNILEGGGLPPSAVSGLVVIETTDENGNKSSTLEKFCIGCGISPNGPDDGENAPCKSALENCKPGKTISKSLRRTYWYKK